MTLLTRRAFKKQRLPSLRRKFDNFHVGYCICSHNQHLVLCKRCLLFNPVSLHFCLNKFDDLLNTTLRQILGCGFHRRCGLLHILAIIPDFLLCRVVNITFHAATLQNEVCTANHLVNTVFNCLLLASKVS